MRAAGTLGLAEAPMFPRKSYTKLIQISLTRSLLEITSRAAADAHRAPLILGKASGAKRIAAGGRLPRTQCYPKASHILQRNGSITIQPQSFAALGTREPGTKSGSRAQTLQGPRMGSEGAWLEMICTNGAWKSTHLSQERSIRHLPGAAQPPGFSGLAAGGG